MLVGADNGDGIAVFSVKIQNITVIGFDNNVTVCQEKGLVDFSL